MSRTLGRRTRQVLAIWAAWTLAGLFYVTQDFVPRIYRDESIPWQRVFIGWMAAMYICAALTPAILWLGRRWRLENERRRWPSVTVHLCCSALFSVVSQTLEVPVLLALGVIPRGTGSGSFAPALWWVLAYGFHGGMLRYWVVVGLQAVARSYQHAREREREALELQVRSKDLAGQLTAAELGALKMQLQPHFLFNTLGAIMVLVQQQKTGPAEAMLARLSDLLRLTLDDAASQEVPLWRELEFLRAYLSIEEVRFEDRLRVRVEADPELLDALVPHMVLQPIVENAIRHGLGQSEGMVTIGVEARKTAEGFALTVTDDGPGSPSLGVGPEGIGLTNTRNRLRRLYGAAATLTAGNRVPHGAAIALRLPFRTAGSEET
jgi:signal transduction histidine kinase